MDTRRRVSTVDYRKKMKESRVKWRRVRPVLKDYRTIDRFLKSYEQIQEFKGFNKKMTFAIDSIIKIESMDCRTPKRANLNKLRYETCGDVCEATEDFLIEMLYKKRDDLYKLLQKDNVEDLVKITEKG
jgi:hypothetical protein